ncbi:hypothetical protein GCM10009850_069170 [Nonomuraea monospora]|uniref:F5/8 type C domain-containing protein n=1 Tax=Nonomuraea monospora TaxID=568818 RepID=A0ABN3CQ78_9ACTN
MHPTRSSGRLRRSAVAVAVALAGLVLSGLTPAAPARAADVLLSQGRPATASSSEGAAWSAAAAVDGDRTGTRWSSSFSDPQWLQVDLGAPAAVTRVVLDWEAAYARSFRIQTSNDAATWTDAYATTTGTGGTQTVDLTATARYVRMYGTARATGYGYSLWERPTTSPARQAPPRRPRTGSRAPAPPTPAARRTGAPARSRP